MNADKRRRICITIAALGIVMILSFLLASRPAPARDDGRYANSPLKQWFDQLASGKGLCCSLADGRSIDDPDIDTSGDHYKVRVDGVWYVVPDDALITEPNKYGKAVVWPAKDLNGETYIRCFLPGAGT